MSFIFFFKYSRKMRPSLQSHCKPSNIKNLSTTSCNILLKLENSLKEIFWWQKGFDDNWHLVKEATVVKRFNYKHKLLQMQFAEKYSQRKLIKQKCLLHRMCIEIGYIHPNSWFLYIIGRVTIINCLLVCNWI